MKTIRNLLLIILLGLIISPFFQQVKAEEHIDLYFFHSDFCLNCREIETFLEQIELDYTNVVVHRYEISDSSNYELYQEVAKTFKLPQAVPIVAIGGIGMTYSENMTQDIEDTIIRYSEHYYRTDIVDKVINGETVLVTDFDTLERKTIQIPFIGEVELESVSILVAAIFLGFSDGFNPCAMWVLVFLITMLIDQNDRKRMWIIGFTFLFVTAAMYYLIMVVWLSLSQFSISAQWMRYPVGAFAFLFGVYQIIRFMQKRKEEAGCEVTDQESKSKIMKRIRTITAKRNIFLAIAGVAVLSISVNLIDLACSVALPLSFTQLLAYNSPSFQISLFYLAIYVFFFMLIPLIIFTIAMVTMKVTGITSKYAKIATFIGGIIMTIIGFLLLFFPNIIMFNF